MQKLLFLVVPLVVAVSLAFASAPEAKTVEPFEAVQCGWTVSITPTDSAGPLTRDTVWLSAVFGPLVQGSIIFDRKYDADTMHGVVSGTMQGAGPDFHTGEFRGVIKPEGMSGTFTLIRTSMDYPDSYRIIGRWETVGHPVPSTVENQMPFYCFHLEGRIIGPFAP